MVIKESWSFEYKGDRYEIVTANNMVANTDPDNCRVYKLDMTGEQPIPRGDSWLAYRLTCKFKITPDGRVQVSKPAVYFGDNIKMLADENQNYFKFPEDGRDSVLKNYYTYQKDENGNTTLYPLYDPAAFDSLEVFTYRNTYVFGDFDGDGKGELGDKYNQIHIYFPPTINFYSLDNPDGGCLFECPVYMEHLW